jgi:tryptophanyl-tRNA synthetase
MTQYKDRVARHESVGMGILDYPVLMAADILLYDTDEVPVGEDQQQHVELARDIAERWNRLHGELFVLPTAVIPAVGARVMGLDDPLVKMSKSYAHVEGHAIRVLDPPESIRRAISRAVTDSGREIRFSDDPAKAGVNNLLGIYQAITEKTPAAVEADFAGASPDVVVRVVDSLEAALEHIGRHGSGHSEAVVTGSLAIAREFQESVDAAVVYVNASPRFTEGGELGAGPQIATSTRTLHARGPIGLEQLTTDKHLVTGDGHVR